MALKIDYDELEMAMSAHDPMGVGHHYLDTETGEVLPVTDWVEGQARQFDDPAGISDETFRLAWYLLWQDGDVGQGLPDAKKQALARQADAYLSRFLEVPTIPSFEAYQDMVNFTDTVNDDHLQELLYVALDGRGAFRRFKDVLGRYPEVRERWFAFSAQCWRERIDEWLRAEGVLPDAHP